MRKTRIVLPLLLLAAVAAYLVYNNTLRTPETGSAPALAPTATVEPSSASAASSVSPEAETPSVPAEDLSAQMQKEFSKKYGKPADTYIVRVKESSDAYAKGSIDFKDEAGGGLWFAAKTDAGWELVFDGNGIIDCATADKYQMPADYVPGCVDTTKENEFVQRQ
jgi:hypothetical protein